MSLVVAVSVKYNEEHEYIFILLTIVKAYIY